MSDFQSDFERFDPREVIAAGPDYLALAFGAALPGRPLHPLAQAIDLPTLAHAFGVTNTPATQRGPASTGPAMVSRGAASTGFAKLIRDATAPVVLRSYQAAAAQRPFAATVALDNFTEQPIFGFDLGHDLTLVRENQAIPRRRAFAPDAGYATASVKTYSQIFDLSRDDLLSNDIVSLTNLLKGAGSLAAGVESRLLADEIEAPAPLSDGAIFDSSNTHAQALSDTALGVAVGMLRKQGAVGRPLNIEPRHLVVSGALELLARKLIRDADLAGMVQVSVLPSLPDARWLVLGDPEQMPSLSLYMLGSTAGTLNFQVQRNFNNDGVSLSCGLDCGAGFVGRIGVVRGGA